MAKKKKGSKKKKEVESESEVDESDMSDMEGGGGGGEVDPDMARLAAKGVAGLNADGTQVVAAVHVSWQFTVIEANREGDTQKMIDGYVNPPPPTRPLAPR